MSAKDLAGLRYGVRGTKLESVVVAALMPEVHVIRRENHEEVGRNVGTMGMEIAPQTGGPVAVNPAACLDLDGEDGVASRVTSDHVLVDVPLA